MSSVAAKRSILAVLILGVAYLAMAGPLADLPAIWNKTVIYAMQMQRDLHRDLAAAMRAVQSDEPAAFWGLVSLGFLYGLFHAVGPGHGKIVISTYLATHESRLLPGLALSFLSSLMQGVTAIVVVGLTALFLERSLRDSQGFGITLEIVSYGLVVLIGLFLVWRGGKRLLHRERSADSQHDHQDGCCHNHGPSATDLEARLSLRDIAIMIFSIGIRPCSGAILVLILAFATGLIWVGTAAVMAMSIGTGLGVAALATLSVYARRTALTFGSMISGEGQMIARLLDIAAMIGGLMIVTFGVMLINASLAVSKHPLL